jgi:hypothetical protein
MSVTATTPFRNCSAAVAVVAEKKEKSEVQYEPVAKMKSERCDLCKHFLELYETCDLVKGKVKPGAWCNLFENK